MALWQILQYLGFRPVPLNYRMPLNCHHQVGSLGGERDTHKPPVHRGSFGFVRSPGSVVWAGGAAAYTKPNTPAGRSAMSYGQAESAAAQGAGAESPRPAPQLGPTHPGCLTAYKRHCEARGAFTKWPLPLTPRCARRRPTISRSDRPHSAGVHGRVMRPLGATALARRSTLLGLYSS